MNVRRQTISKVENDKTIPNIYEVNAALKFLNITIEELLNYEEDISRIEKSINKTSEDKISKIDWTKLLEKRYPISLKYKQMVNSLKYKESLDNLITDLKNYYH